MKTASQRLDYYERRVNAQDSIIANQHSEIESLRETVKELQTALQAEFADLILESDDRNPGRVYEHSIHNDPIRKGIARRFKAMKEWAGRNLGWGNTLEEKQATGLAYAVGFANMEPQEAVLFAAAVCDNHNYHPEAARLEVLYEALIAPVPQYRRETCAESVGWWAS